MSEERRNHPQDEEPARENMSGEAEEQEKFSFIQETIKDEHPSGKRLFHKVIKIAGLGLIFGLAASLGFYALKPWAEVKFQQDPSKVTIPEDEEEEDVGEEEGEEETEPPVLTIDNYKELDSARYQVGNKASKSMVEVTGILEGESWIGSSYDSANSVSGVFVEDNGQEVLILTYTSILKEAAGIQVTFSDGQTYSADIKKKDENLGLAVLSVPRSNIKQNTWSHIEMAVLGNSNTVTRGEGIIALGKQYGFSGGMGYGAVSSVRNSVAKADGEYSILNTDMAAAEHGTGILINYKGEVIGLIDQSIAGTESENLITAYAISDLKSPLENLLNAESVPYMGIWGADITEELAEQQGLPQGIYVAEVDSDSPAMETGIKSGDIITEFGKETVANLSAYNRELMSSRSGGKVKVKAQRLGGEGYVDVDFEVTIGSKE